MTKTFKIEAEIEVGEFSDVDNIEAGEQGVIEELLYDALENGEEDITVNRLTVTEVK